ncbi:hypothetical protein C8R47DRAFT_1074299 [Mycena vitilis]|nr:hypothetical protein C8R47DRAFT_1074299 [Mycena vitilis]
MADELGRSEKEVLRIRACLAAAEAVHSALKERYELFRYLEAPIRRPSELLLRIFKTCEEDATYRNAESPVVLDSSPMEELAEFARKPLLTLSQVCIRWHDQGTTSFWAPRLFGITSSSAFCSTSGSMNRLPRRRDLCFSSFSTVWE